MQEATFFTYIVAFVPILFILAASRYITFQRWPGRLEQVLSSSNLTNGTAPSQGAGSSASGNSRHVQFSDTEQSDNNSSPMVTKESEFPNNWWNGDDIFNLERKAIFSKVTVIKVIVGKRKRKNF